MYRIQIVAAGLTAIFAISGSTAAFADSPSPSPTASQTSSQTGYIPPVTGENPAKKPQCKTGQVLVGSFCVQRHEKPVKRPTAKAPAQQPMLPYTGFPSGTASLIACAMILAGAGLMRCGTTE